MKSLDHPTKAGEGKWMSKTLKHGYSLRRILDLGSLRVLLVLAAIWLYFGLANPAFVSSINLTNLALQIAAVGAVSIGVVLVLLIGEIDLSVGAISGMCAALVAVLSVHYGLPAYAAMAAGVAVGALVGTAQGIIVTWLSIPSFVVTLAGFLGWAGVKLAILGSAGTINVTDKGITNIANKFLPIWLSSSAVFLIVFVTLVSTFLADRRRVSAGIERDSFGRTFTRPIILSLVLILGAVILSQDRGVPVSLCLLVGCVALFSFIVTETRFGRYILAVGGSKEAARRVGIPVRWIKIAVFALSGAFGAAGGILAMARLLSVDQSAGSGNFLLYAIAGPVIAGVSLFGGRGSVWAALTGAIVIGSIQNGMNLLAYPASTQSIVTALVLLFAVMLDALSRSDRR